MKRFLSKTHLLCFVLYLLIVCDCNKHCKTVERVSRFENFEGNEILVHFLENERTALDISKIRNFFVIPTNFYCSLVETGDKLLPLFFVNATRNNFFSFFIYFFTHSEKEVQAILSKDINFQFYHELICNLTNRFNCSSDGENAEEYEQFFKETFPDEQVTKLTNKLFLQYFHQIRFIIPIVLLADLFFPQKPTIWNLVNFFGTKEYINYQSKNEIIQRGADIGSGSFGSCYKIAMYSKITNGYDNKFVLKVIKELGTCPIWNLTEITVLSNLPTACQTGICKPNSLVLDSNGNGVGYLMKLAKFGDLNHFLKHTTIVDYKYFNEQLMQLAESIEMLHVNGIIHNDIAPRNIFVEKKTTNGSDYYKFLLADFGYARLTYQYHSYHYFSIQKHDSKVTPTKDYENYKERIQNDWKNFTDLTNDVLAYLYWKKNEHSFTKAQPLLIITVTRNILSFEQAQSHLSSLSADSNEQTGNITVQKYKISNIPTGFDVICHNPESVTKYSNGDLFTFSSNLNYRLYHIEKDSIYPISIHSDKVHALNTYFKRHYKTADDIFNSKIDY